VPYPGTIHTCYGFDTAEIRNARTGVVSRHAGPITHRSWDDLSFRPAAAVATAASAAQVWRPANARWVLQSRPARFAKY
jgi:hypothetical protein